ncbi:unnamed protein product [Cylicocyclus nassatus]|uniref:Uncharacterized protein n=1 Tax=Cylicocyclus nassatus TaxID=53992 RepID=A0AA36HFK7_CYLNA|nr:unnamed protein product [Cylicocyclus nassatus]
MMIYQSWIRMVDLFNAYQASQKCSLVGRDYICCEHIGGTAQVDATEKPRTKASKVPSQPLECPSNSIGLLSRNGLPVMCNARKRCPSKAYCHPVGGQSICCESYEFASNILDSTENNIRRSENKAPLQVLDRSSLTVANNAEVERSPSRTPVPRSRSAEQENYQRNTIQLKQSVEKKAAVRTTSGSASTLISSEASTRNVPVSADGMAELSSERVFNTPTTTEKSESVATTEQIRAPPKRKAPAAFAAVSVPEQGNQVKPLSPNLPSQLFSGQDKRIMAEQFLMHQIRNGWPYDEKFYRPDVDTYSPQQRQRMAQIFFSDNQ